MCKGNASLDVEGDTRQVGLAVSNQAVDGVDIHDGRDVEVEG